MEHNSSLLSEHDQNNLNFLLNITEDVFNDWLEQIDLDDAEYAIELLVNYSSRMINEELNALDDVQDTSHAQQLLQRFHL